jgi:hypothetical protein
MPPVSVTMQALNLAATAGALLDALLEGLVPDEPELEPHAAASRETALSPATIPNFPLTGLPPLPGAAIRSPGRAADLIAKPQPARARKSRKPPGFPKASPDVTVREVGNCCPAGAVAESRPIRS